MSLKLDKPRGRGAVPTKTSSIPLPVASTISREVKDVLEKKVEDLSRQLAEEQQISRQNKMSATRMQREINRWHPKKESLSKELEHERMLRAEAEHKLHEITQESDSCRSRLHALQEEFKKMEEVVQNMMQYKSKIDQLKQEKSSLSVTYENNLQKFGSHISDLERENMVLLNEVKKLESQMNNKTTDGRDKSKLLLERLRMLEKENSSLVLENEQQRQQYEKCLDEIANQVVQALLAQKMLREVVQALLAQKMLREECMKLQNRVHDLELQNRQLSVLFHQRMKLTSDSVHQHSLKPDELGEQNIFVQGSIESLQSIFSEQMSENLASMPQMSTPPPWLQERLSLCGDQLSGDRLSIISLPGSIQSTPDLNSSKSDQGELCCRTMIETEFPATLSSPKVKHINVFERKKETKRSSSTSSLVIPARQSKARTRSTSSLSRARGLSLSPQGMARSELSSGSPIFISPNQGNLDSGQLGNQSVLTAQQTGSLATSQENVQVAGLQTSMTQTQVSPVPSQVNLRTSTTSTSVPVSVTQSPSPTRKQVPQGHITRQTSKLPVFSSQVPQNKEQVQTRRNSKGETGIRMGCQSPVHKPQPVSSDIKNSQTRSPPASSKPSTSTSTSRIPSVSKSVAKSQKSVKTTTKEKGSLNRQNSNSSSKLATTGSSQVKQPGIKTTLKPETKVSPPSFIKPTASVSSVVSSTSITLSATVNANNVINTNSKSASGGNVSVTKGKDIKNIQRSINVSSMPPWRHEGPYANPRPETHFPRMGTTNLTHPSPKTESSVPKSETVTAIAVKTLPVPKSSTPKSELPSVKPENFVSNIEHGPVTTQLNNVNKGQYFYDYSDEDSDWNRPVSKDFSIASSISLDEMLDKTLENIDTPVDTDFSSDNHFLFKSPVLINGAISENNNVPSETTEASSSNNNAGELNDNADRLRGKPDIVKDTEECEQRNMKKSMTISQIPGSGIAGYRARRPRSLILSSKDSSKKFVYAEYGSSSSLDSTSDEDWSYQFSYAKNVRQQEIQTKVAKSLQSGNAKEIGTPTNISTLEMSLNAQNEKNNKTSKVSSQLPRPALSKKLVKTPPPIAQKPVKKRSPSNSSVGERPKSVEICVNTALIPTVSKPITTYLPFHDTVGGINENDLRFMSEKFSTLPQAKTESGEKKLDTSDSFDEVTVERSGSRDDGYSTMSSDVQPEAMEKFSDENIKEKQSHYICEGDIHKSKDELKNRFDVSSDPDSAIETSVLGHNKKDSGQAYQNLSSPTSVSSGDRHSQCGSLGRVRAMKLKYELEIQNKSPEREMNLLKSPPQTPPKSPKRFTFQDKASGIPKPASKIPLARQSNIPVSSAQQQPSVLSKIPVSQTVNTSTKPNTLCIKQTGLNYAKDSVISQDKISNIENKSRDSQSVHDQFSGLTINEQFSQLFYFMPPSEPVSFLREGGYDSSSSTSERDSDLTSLHISEDNILSDIPEEKEGYESSVGKLSEANSLTSIPLREQQNQNIHTCCQHQKVHFEVRLRKYWTSEEGLMRAVKDRDINRQSIDIDTSVFDDDIYGGTLNMETPLDRSASESDIYTKRDKPPEKQWLPRLSRRRCTVDELTVEGQVNDILKQIVFQQLSKTAESADSDDKSFSNFVEMLRQKGHVLDTSSSFPNMETSLQSRMSVSCSSVSSSKGQYSNEHFEQEERQSRESSCGPVGEEQKQFNSNFYSLCNVGSNHSISENSESKTEDLLNKKHKRTNGVKDLRHDCDKVNEECKKCLEEKNAREFDEISKQIESLSRTVNELHRSLTSLNSENNDSGSESNEGDHSSLFNSAIGNKEIDGYQWLEDEFFLSPYGGEIILGTSPFSDTGASCDWMNEYMEDGSHFDETSSEHEAMHDRSSDVSSVELGKKSKQKIVKAEKSSILSGMMDDEGNFDSQEFISKRLQLEEEKLGATADGDSGTFPVNLELAVSALRDRPGVRQVLKEDLHTTPEKDHDTSFTGLQEMSGTRLLQSDLGAENLNLSQDSLDDNIGVDQVMCHRFLGKSERKPATNRPGSRPALDFSSQLFMRYGDLEKEAVAAFDFLDDASTTSVTSPDSKKLSSQRVEKRVSHDRQTSASTFPPQSSDFSPNKMKQIFKTGYVTESHDRFSKQKVERAVLHGVNMDQSVSSTDSSMTPVKRSRRKPRAKIKKGDQASCKRPLRRVSKFSSTSADESYDELSFSDSCCYHSYSSSTDSLEDKV